MGGDLDTALGLLIRLNSSLSKILLIKIHFFLLIFDYKMKFSRNRVYNIHSPLYGDKI